MCKGPEALLSHRLYNSQKSIHRVYQVRGTPWNQLHSGPAGKHRCVQEIVSWTRQWEESVRGSEERSGGKVGWNPSVEALDTGAL